MHAHHIFAVRESMRAKNVGPNFLLDGESRLKTPSSVVAPIAHFETPCLYTAQ